MRLGVLALSVVLFGASIAGGEEAKPAGPSAETWLTIRALSAETQALEERFGRLSLELNATRQGFIERRGQWDAAVTDLAKTMAKDATKCVPDPATRTWVPRRSDITTCDVTKAP